MKYEILNTDGEVINTIVSDPEIIEQLYPGQYREVSEPDIPEPSIRVISRYAFRSRFTTEEKQAIYTAAESNITIKIWLDDLASAENVDLDLPETVSNVTSLESAGLIAEGRAEAILA